MRGGGADARARARTALLAAPALALALALPLATPAARRPAPGAPPRPSAGPSLLSTAHAGEPSVGERLSRFRAAARGDDHAARERAYDDLADLSDPRVADAILFASALHARERAALRARIAKDDAASADAARDLERARRAYEKIDAPTSAHYARYHEERTRLEDLRRTLAASLEADRFRVDRLGRLLDRARDAMTRILARVPEESVPDVLERARAAWLHGATATLEDRLRFVDAIAWVRRPGVEEALARLVDDPIDDVRVRGVAMRVRAERHDRGALEQAVALLAAPSWVLEAAAIEALRVLHERASIEPLIAFLGREDLGRLREDARRALCSLTGEAIGPYREAWAAWWRDASRDFELPRRPAPVAPLGGADAAASFYGISTFSRRVLFVLDVSGSMAEPDRATRGGERKIDVARRELAAALYGLDVGGTFGVLLFQEDVVGSPGGVVRTEDGTRTRALAFVRGVEPSGPTNVAAALEAAYDRAGTGAIDTVFFLTDGRASVGAVQTAEGLLDLVARRGRGLPVVIHAIGLGEHDADLLRRLADATGGRYVTR